VEVREKAQQRVRPKAEGYALITPQNAAAAVERNTLKRGKDSTAENIPAQSTPSLTVPAAECTVQSNEMESL